MTEYNWGSFFSMFIFILIFCFFYNIFIVNFQNNLKINKIIPLPLFLKDKRINKAVKNKLFLKKYITITSNINKKHINLYVKMDRIKKALNIF